MVLLGAILLESYTNIWNQIKEVKKIRRKRSRVPLGTTLLSLLEFVNIRRRNHIYIYINLDMHAHARARTLTHTHRYEYSVLMISHFLSQPLSLPLSVSYNREELPQHVDPTTPTNITKCQQSRTAANYSLQTVKLSALAPSKPLSAKTQPYQLSLNLSDFSAQSPLRKPIQRVDQSVKNK